MKLVSRIAAVAAALVFLEIALRAILGMGRPLLTEKDPAVGYMAAPNQDVHRFFQTIEINSFGMRSDQIARAKPPRETAAPTTAIGQFANRRARDRSARTSPVPKKTTR